MTAACDGLRVIDFTSWMAGPLATMLLADNGADVVKIEPPGGDPARSLPAFQTWNRGKKSVVLDLKTGDGQAKALDLIRGADVVVVGFRPGVADRLGIGFQRVHELNPQAVYGVLTGFGEEGRLKHLKGYEALVAAKLGRMTVYERIADRPGPAFPALPYGSFSASMLLAQGVLAALHRRRETGQGEKVSVSLLAALLPYDLVHWITPQIGPIQEDSRRFATDIAGRTYDPRRLQRPEVRVPRPSIWAAPTRDGVWLWVENTAHHLCAAQMSALDLLDLYSEERFAQLPAVFNETDAEDLWEILLERVRSKTYVEWRGIFDQYEIGVEEIRSPRESVQHRQVVHNGQVARVDGLLGKPTLQPGSLVRFSRSEVRIDTRAPQLDEHGHIVSAEHVRTPISVNLSTADSRPPGAGPLSGVTVLDFSTWIAGAYATAILANLGARVVSVEPLGGEPGRYLLGGLVSFVTSQGKQSIAVDLKQAAGRQIVEQLIARADAVYHNFRVGVVERLGLDYESCRKINPDILYVNAAAYGDSGPDARRPAFAGTVAAMTGYALRQAGEGHPVPGCEALDIESLKHEAWRLARTIDGNGDLNAALGSATALLLGLYERDMSGQSQALMTTMIGSNMLANSDELIIANDGQKPLRAGENLFGLSPLYRLYESSDGWVFLACPRQNEWEAFCRAVQRPDLVQGWDSGWQSEVTSAAAGQLGRTIQEILCGRSSAEWEGSMAEQDVPLVAVELRDPGRFCLEEEVMKDLGYMVKVDSPQYGAYWRHGALQQFSTEQTTLGPCEPVGGHSRAILDELGYGAAEVGRLVDQKVVEVAPSPAT